MSSTAPAELALIRHAGSEVEAGGLIARGPLSLCPGAAPGAADIGLPLGAHEVRAARDGRVVAGPGGLGVSGRTVIEGHLTRGGGHDVLRVKGTLVVEGGIGAGMRLEATGDVLVHGPVERSEIIAGGAILLESRASGAHLWAGVLTGLERHQRGRLRLLPRALERAAQAAENLIAAASARGMRLDPGRALALGVGATWPALTGRLGELDRILRRVHEDLPEAAPGLAREVRGLLVALEAEEGEECLALARAVAHRLTARTREHGRRLQGVRARALHRCQVSTPGSVRLTGEGARESDVRAGGDVTVPGGGVADGEVVLGGRLQVRDLGRRGALTEVRLLVVDGEAPGLERDRVAAGRVLGPCEVRGPLGGAAVDAGDGELRLYLASGVPLVRT